MTSRSLRRVTLVRFTSSCSRGRVHVVASTSSCLARRVTGGAKKKEPHPASGTDGAPWDESQERVGCGGSRGGGAARTHFMTASPGQASAGFGRGGAGNPPRTLWRRSLVPWDMGRRAADGRLLACSGDQSGLRKPIQDSHLRTRVGTPSRERPTQAPLTRTWGNPPAGDAPPPAPSIGCPVPTCALPHVRSFGAERPPVERAGCVWTASTVRARLPPHGPPGHPTAVCSDDNRRCRCQGGSSSVRPDLRREASRRPSRGSTPVSLASGCTPAS